MALMTLIFVYGTLKKSQPNYYRMLDSANGQARFLGSARTVDPYPLVIRGEFNIPFLMNVRGEGARVSGELYSVDDRMLSFLDAFEGVPTMYQRVRLEVQEEAPGGEAPGGSTVEAHAYVSTPQEHTWRALPSYESYDAYGPHGLAYISRESRQ